MSSCRVGLVEQPEDDLLAEEVGMTETRKSISLPPPMRSLIAVLGSRRSAISIEAIILCANDGMDSLRGVHVS